MEQIFWLKAGRKAKDWRRKLIKLERSPRMAFFGRKSPIEALVMPAVCKYNQFRQRRREAQSKKVTERELTALHHKIVSIPPFIATELPRDRVAQK